MDEVTMTELMRKSLLQRRAYSVETVRGMERPLLDQGVPLMRMAASAAARITAELLDEHDVDIAEAKVVLLAGAGDNGGDGLFAAAQLARTGAQVTAIAVGKSLHLQGLLAFTRSGGRLLIVNPDADIPGVSSGFSAGEAGERLQAAIELTQQADVILDAMTGIGVKGALRGPAATMANILHPTNDDGTEPDKPQFVANAEQEQKPLVVAIDTPSGVGVDDGTLPGSYIPADVTVMFGAMKPCAMLPPASFACGRTVLVDFGFDITRAYPVVFSIDDTAGSMIRLPKPTDSKYSRGVVGLITGSAKYPGAAVLSSGAAVRSNIGMVRYLGPVNASDMVLRKNPEIVIGKGRVEAWAVGSGVPTAEATNNAENENTGRHSVNGPDGQREAIAALLKHYALPDENVSKTTDETEIPVHDLNKGETSYKSKRAGIVWSNADPNIDYDSEPWTMPPICVDAGALDLLPKRVPAHVIITPHAAELAALLRLRGEDVDTASVIGEPWRWAKRAHELTGATVLLKGAVTIVVGDANLTGLPAGIEAGPENADGTSKMTTTYISGSGPAWLATAGAGDVLAGVMAGMLAQQGEEQLQHDPNMDIMTAASASYIHGYAASLASESDQHGWEPPEIFDADGTIAPEGRPGHPIVATDIIAALPNAISKLMRNIQ
ncbi:bifunctional ADP-dependent NAD(P)H-hydrate dehydratase/NAD(P)H-hydrate epimerase [Bifidobacterium sp. ESL0728]|uniref:bifunctional ADP-dependent NAD(P)H-hydrate dehydratase/NAD(P)H-hydrate epimerase n=1 Tax=Bifidobacterium sp. ESL0728 TaxID=2983220 RepID=UPI0023FA0334|nr:bifunctional ADP-dependent NAD(P)H-hydrate dehydratase/NAD(P)H-hydrate epimerase [Bifidobacterium sp. ESL0728]WEV59869.1 bifunctional ADP-dependent NAD(P)H-hydrate dehydratase/NAD(P)H-hydrate epimerase [Bifidobacterium sp. ESL0728]